MSQYIYFFIKGTDRFYPICESSRSTEIAQLAHGAPYEKLRAMTSSEICDILDEIDEFTGNIARRIAYEHDLQHQIATFNNELDEKMRAIEESNERVRELEDEQEDLDDARSFYRSLSKMLEVATDKDNYIYVGWEIGLEPTFEDIAD